MKRPRRHSGFTLLELTVSMMIVVILSATLYSSLSVAIAAKRSAERAITPIRAGSIAFDVMGQDIESVVRPHLMMTGNAPATSNNTTTPYLQFGTSGYCYLYAGGFYGTSGSGADSIQFCTIGTDGTPDVPLSDGIRQIEYLLSTDDKGGSVLIRRITRNLPPTGADTPDEEKLCKNVLSFTVRYYDGTDWYTEWDSDSMVDFLGTNPAIPLAVEVTLELKVDGVTQPGHDKDTYTIRRVFPISTAMPM